MSQLHTESGCPHLPSKSKFMNVYSSWNKNYTLLQKDDQNKKRIWALQATNSGKNYAEVTSCYGFLIIDGTKPVYNV